MSLINEALKRAEQDKRDPARPAEDAVALPGDQDAPRPSRGLPLGLKIAGAAMPVVIVAAWALLGRTTDRPTTPQQAAASPLNPNGPKIGSNGM